MIWLALAALAALTTTAAPSEPPAGTLYIPPATLDESLEITGDSLDAKQINTRMFVAVDVNGHGPYRFLVDSGADRSVIGAGLARRLALPTAEPVRLRGMAGSSDVTTVSIDRLKIGSSVIEDIVAPALPEKFIGAQGLLGIDALAEQRLMLDFDAKRVIIQDSRTPEPSGHDEIVITARRSRGQLILTQASVGTLRVSAVIDTGAEVTMGNLALQRRVFRGREPKEQQFITLVSVTGQSVGVMLAVVPEIHIGAITLANVQVAFADVPPFALFGLDKEPALLLGTDLLQSFRRVSLDFRRRKVRFTLRH